LQAKAYVTDSQRAAMSGVLGLRVRWWWAGLEGAFKDADVDCLAEANQLGCGGGRDSGNRRFGCW